MTVLEEDLRQLIRNPDSFPLGTVWFCEPGRGADTGLPDCWVDTNGQYSPLELKRGKSIVKALRPTQRLFHKMTLRRGIASYGLSIVNPDEILLFRLLIKKDLAEEMIARFSSNTLNYGNLTINW